MALSLLVDSIALVGANELCHLVARRHRVSRCLRNGLLLGKLRP